MLKLLCAGLLIIATSLASAAAASAAYPVRWQISVGPEAVLTARSATRSPFSPNSNASPAMLPTQLFPQNVPATQDEFVLRGDVQMYLAVDGFDNQPGTSRFAIALDELRLVRESGAANEFWRIPSDTYAKLLERLRQNEQPTPR